MTYDIEIRTAEPRPTATIRLIAPHATLGQTFAEVLPEVGQALAKKGLQMASAPFGIFHAMLDDSWDLEAGVCVDEPLAAADGRVQPSEMPSGPCAFTVHVGPYDKLGTAHDAVRAWCEENGRKQTGVAWEYYVNDPGTTPPAEWRTEIYAQLVP
jgi:effector-binding domain-containing protein